MSSRSVGVSTVIQRAIKTAQSSAVLIGQRRRRANFIRNSGRARRNRPATRTADARPQAQKLFACRLYRPMTLRGPMLTMSRAVIILGLSLMLLASAEAVADDSVAIRIYNDDADDILLSVYDMNAQPPGAVLASQRINGFAWIPVSVTAGAAGNGHIMWIARTAGASFHRCGHQEMRGLADDDSVRLFADSKCVRIVR